MRLTDIEPQPFHSLRYWTSSPRGLPQLRELPFYRATATGLPPSLRSLVLASDLQGREYLSGPMGGNERLLGEVLADELALLVELKTISPVDALLVCGDLYEYPDCRKPGGTGAVDSVFHAFAAMCPEVGGVLGNHDVMHDPNSLPKNVTLLDGQEALVAGIRVGGVGGIIGDPKRHQRRPEEGFLAAIRDVMRRRPNVLLLHQGPEGPQSNQPGHPAVTESLEKGFSGMTIFGHTHWGESICIDLGAGQAVNVDKRVVVLVPPHG